MPEDRFYTRFGELLAVTALCACFLFYGAGSFGIVGADEPRYAQIAREMLERRDWVTPTLGGTPWLEKPVLYYWGAQISFSIFGVTEFAARFPSALLASIFVFAAYFFMRRFRPGSQIDAAIVTATTVGWIGFARGASTDMPLAATLGTAMLAWATWMFTSRRRWLAVFYLFAALATLAKGPVAPFLAGTMIVLLALWKRELSLVWRTLWLPGIVLYLAVALPWFIAVELATGQFVEVFILKHNLARFGTNMFHHRQPYWYYFAVVPLTMLPWTVLFGASVISSIRSLRHETDPVSRDLLRLLLLWIAVPFVLFSISQSKLPGYILPVVPACGLLTADYIYRKLREGSCLPGFTAALHAAVVAVTVTSIALANFFLLKVDFTASTITIAVLIAVAIFLATILALMRKSMGVMRLVTLAPMVFALAFLITVVTPTIDARDSARPVARELERIGPETPVAGFDVSRTIEYGMHFYRNRPFARYERGEIPATRHVLLINERSEARVREILGGRPMVRLGDYAPQRLQYWLVAPAE